MRRDRADNEKLLENVARLLHVWFQRQAAENNRIHELEQMICELRGELRATRSMLDDARSNVIDLRQTRLEFLNLQQLIARAIASRWRTFIAHPS